MYISSYVNTKLRSLTWIHANNSLEMSDLHFKYYSKSTGVAYHEQLIKFILKIK